MAVQSVTSIPIPSPGYFGLNTTDSPVNMSTAFAAIADNAVIDNFGRIGSRQGFQNNTDNPSTTYGNYACERVFEFIDLVGNSYVLSSSGGNIFKNDITARAATALTLPTSYTIGVTENNWQLVSLGDRAYLIQKGKLPLEFAPATSSSALVEILTSGGSWPSGATGYPSCATTGFGRLFVGGFDSNKSLIVYSTLEDGSRLQWDGAIDVREYWPNGTDVITAIEVQNDFLIVFGERSILVYGTTNTDPSVYSLALTDTVSGIGCIARDSTQVIGTDLIFLDSSGLRSLGRTIQEKSLPIGSLSLTVETDIEKAIARTSGENITSFFSPEYSFYALTFGDNALTYVFDTKIPLDNRAFRATLWPSRLVRCGFRSVQGETYIGGIGGLYKYSDNFDRALVDFTVVPSNGQYTYFSTAQAFVVNFRYWTHPQSFGAPDRIKFLKDIDVVISGGIGSELFLKWIFNYSESPAQLRLNQAGEKLYEYAASDSEYNTSTQYGSTGDLIASRDFKLWGSGRVVAFGFEAAITTNHFSVQELNIQALLGRII